jgi:putative ABC transport system permease protein
VNTVSALLIEQTRQIGVMKSMGAGVFQLLAIYIGMVLVFGLCAVAIAIPLSMWASSIVVSYVVSVVNFNVTTLAMPASILVLELAAGIVVPLLAALAPVLSGCRMSIRDALASDSLGVGFGESPIDRLLSRVSVLPDAVRLSLRNAFRRKGRLSLTLAALILGGAFFIGVLSVRDSLQNTTENEFHYMRYDLEAVFTGPQPIGPVLRTAQRVPGVSFVEPWATLNAYRMEPGGTESGVVSVIGPTLPTRMAEPIMAQGRWLTPSDGNALVMGSDFYSSNPDLQVGGDVTLRIAGKATTWHIVGVARTRFFGVGTSSGPAVYVPARALAQADDTPDRANTIKVVGVKHDPASQADLANNLQAALDRAGYPISYTQTIAAVRASREGPNDIIVKFLISMAVLLALVGGLGLAGTMSINVLERIRELGVMRSIGAGQLEIFQIVLVEGIVIGLLGWLIGTLLSVPVSTWLSDLTSEELLSQPPTFAYALGGVGLWLLIVLGLAATATAAPAWRATRITIRVALAYE